MIAKKLFFLKFYFIFSNMGQEGFWKFSLLRELQISVWPIAPSNFSPLCLMAIIYCIITAKSTKPPRLITFFCFCIFHCIKSNIRYIVPKYRLNGLNLTLMGKSEYYIHISIILQSYINEKNIRSGVSLDTSGKNRCFSAGQEKKKKKKVCENKKKCQRTAQKKLIHIWKTSMNKIAHYHNHGIQCVF